MRSCARGVRRLYVVWFTFFSLVCFPAFAEVVGSIPGEFSVSESGAATYTIPISVPPGVAGLEPKLALTYNSQGGNGLLGMGWSLSGLSVIHRCPKTFAQDGTKGGINLDADDRYCLDGQRLVAISGSYGGADTEYRTEDESYSRIISYGAQGSGPSYFKVWTKSGQIMEYGVTNDSRIEAQGKSEVMLWALSKVSDTAGNYLTVNYTEDNANGQYYPTRIDYAGNSNTGKAPTNSVQFTYEGRPDVVPTYVGGSLIKSTSRMTNVMAYAGATLVKNLRLSYEQSTSIQRSRLTGLVECAGDGACLPATALLWLQSPNTFTLAPTDGNNNAVGLGAPWSGDLVNVYLGDFNGDGKTDILRQEKGAYANDSLTMVQVYLGNGDGTFTLAPTDGNSNAVGLGAPWSGDLVNVYLGDFNGDGKTDILRQEKGAYANDSLTMVQVYLGNGDGTFTLAPTDGNSNAVGLGAPWSGDLVNVYLGDFNGDGKTDILRQEKGAYANDSLAMIQVYPANSYVSDLISSMATGLGLTTSVTYKPLTDGSVYTRGTGAAYPYVDLQAPIYVVSSTAISNGVGGTRTTNYTYGGAKADLSGRGMLGFRWIKSVDQDMGITSYTEYSQTHPYIGMPIKSQRSLNGVILNESTATLAAIALGGTRYFSYVARSVEQSFEMNGAFVSSTTTDKTYDNFGNPTQIVVSSHDGYVKTTTSTYDNDVNNWILGRLRTAQVRSTLPDGTSAVRTSSFAYNPTTGAITQEVIEPGTAYALTTDYAYDSFGNKVSVTVSGPDIVTRTTTTTYDAQGRFPIKTTNALGHTETRVFDPRFGTVTSLTGPNGLTTTWTYDSFGRKTSETRADGTKTTWALTWCDASCPQWAKYYSTVTHSGAPTTWIFYDSLNREIRQQTQGFDGGLIAKDTQYNALGQVSSVSRPYKSGTVVQWSTSLYDGIGRLVQVTGPDGSITRTDYSGLTETITNALGQITTRVKNSQGQLAQVTDALGNTTRYTYDAFGNLIKTLDPANNSISIQYDVRGRKISMTDPDMGHWRYAYNALGELVSQTDAKNQVITMQYDKLGRMTRRSEPDLIGTWEYDTAANGIGKLAKVTGSNGYVQTLAYDALGRPIRATTTIDTTYQINTAYDSLGRVDTVTYPTGFAARKVYNALGYLAEVRNAANNALFWRANEQDAEGHITNETLGNGLTTSRAYHAQTGMVSGIYTGNSNGWTVQNHAYVFDSIGNLKYRNDLNRDVAEDFTYDALNRLASASHTGLSTKSYQYNAIGNLVYKSDVGTYTYGTDGVRPHAVVSVAGTLNAAYSYDANGNMTVGAGREVSYTSFNMPSRISTGSHYSEFVYDPDHARVKQQTDTTTTIYLSARYDTGLHFEKETKGGLTQHKHYLYAGKALIGVHITKSDGPSSTRYFHHDHIGSIAVITDEAGAVVARFAFDPHGKRILLSGDANATHHGFTGHEELADLGLVHMNGRVYDPTLGRFMSADPTIQFFDNLQGLNRYSYVLNNPLSFTDPSGYKIKWKKIFRAVVAIVAAYFTAGAVASAYASWALPAGTVATAGQVAAVTATAKIVGGVAGGFVGGAIQTGTLKGALGGALTGGLFAGVGNLELSGISKVGAHALAGGISSAIQGGDFKSGFLSAGFSAYAGNILPDMGIIGNGVARAIVGGTASVLGGGKFENGAATATFAYLFNDVIHDPRYRISSAVKDRLEEFNDYIGRDKDIVITGGNRPATSKLGARSTSQHVLGNAADIYVPGQSHLETANQALNFGKFGGVGWYQEGYRGPNGEGPHAHVDIRPVKPDGSAAQWGYDRSGRYYRQIPSYP